MKRYYFSSLRIRLILLVLLAIIPALGLVFYTAEEQRRSTAIEAQQNALRLARLVSANQHDLIEGGRQLLTALAQIPAVRDGQPVQCDAFLRNLLAAYPLYANFGVVGSNGDIFCSALPLNSQVNTADRAWFQRAIQTRDFVIGDYQVGRITGKATVNFAYPVLASGTQVKAVIFAALDLSWFNKLAAKTQLPPGAMVTVIDRNHTVLARDPDLEHWIGRLMPDGPLLKAVAVQKGEGTADANGLDGVPRLYGFASLGSEAVGASVIVGIPRSIAFASADRILVRNLVALGTVAVFALVAAWFGSNLFVLRQVSSLIKATKRLGGGELSARTEISYGKGELSELARTFDQMAASMEQLITDRERSEQRLASLYAINVATTSSLDLQAVLSVLLEKIDFFLPYPVATTVRLFNRDSGELESLASRGLNEEEWRAQERRSLSGRVKKIVETKAPLAVRNVQTDPRTYNPEIYRKYGLMSYLGVPLIAKGGVVGILAVYTKEEHEFTKEEIEFLSTLAGQAAMAIYNAQLYKQVRQRTHALSALYAVASTANETLNLDTVLQAVIRQITEIFHFDATRIFLLDSERKELHLRDCFEATPGVFGIRRMLRLGEGINGKVAEKGKPMIFENVQSDPSYQAVSQTKATQKGDFSFFAVFPIKARQKVVGTIVCIGKKPRRLTTDEIQLILSMADPVGVAIENATLFERTKNQALELRQANTVKNEFLGFVSHELRMPVNVIMGYTALIQDQMTDEISAEQKKALENINTSSGDLLGMIDQLLEATKIEAGAVRAEIHEVNLRDLLEDLRSACAVSLSKGIQLIWDYSSNLPIVRTDGEKLRHILLNLIGNAIKYTNEGSVAVSTRYLAEAGQVEFEVADTGIGIPNEELPRVFEMFSQVRGVRSRSSGGVGLGLYIVKRFTELLGGSISVKSERGRGSTFTVRIPCRPEGQRPAEGNWISP